MTQGTSPSGSSVSPVRAAAAGLAWMIFNVVVLPLRAAGAHRLRADVTVARARSEMQALHTRLERDFPRHKWLQRTLRIMPLQEKLAEPVSSSS